ncbi:MAG: oxidoreductase [Alphaproteobacteria bacterium]|nr:oxidoreductase [Alphaproteobacteria bacterium]
MRVRIYRPSKTAMQSGRAKTHAWVIEPEIETPRTPEPLMGWVSAGDTLTELLNRLRFDSKEEAVAFAVAKGWEYIVVEAKERRIMPRSFAENLRFIRPQDEERSP